MIKFELTPADMAICKVYAGLRTAAARVRGIKNHLDIGDNIHGDNEEIGVRAEYGFCKAFNLFFNPVIGEADPGYDCELHGRTVDIKAISHTHHQLVSFLESKGKSELFVLIHVNGNLISIMGWIHNDTLCQESNIQDLGYGNRYVMPSSKLKSCDKWVSKGHANDNKET